MFSYIFYEGEPVLPAFYLIGHPLGHSMSPFLHQRLFDGGKLGGATYQLRDLAPEDLADGVLALRQTAVGMNVTIPHKQAVIPLLDRLDGSAARYGAVNTVAFTKDGAIGYNTDGIGFRYALGEAGVPLAGKVGVIGCGGAARVFLCEAAAEGCEIVNIVLPRSQTAAEQLRGFVLDTVADVPYEIAHETAGHFDLLINATPVGMYPKVDASPVDFEKVTAKAVFDAVYNPRETKFIRDALATGAKAVGGMPMLVGQAAAAQEIWYGAKFDADTLHQLIDDAQIAMAEGRFG